jgi:tRNA-2-methylthio-N6-dimethylallyladenosine synthase
MQSYHLVTFGCQMNQHDSERMAEVLEGAGYRAARGLDDADLVLLNTCSVREKAEHKLRSEVGRLGLLKRRRPDLVIAVAGCVAQQEGERLLRRLPQIDLIVGPDNLGELPELLRQVELGGPPAVRAVFDLDAPRFLAAAPAGNAAPTAYVTVMKGCDERCSFCIVPHTRGPERYRAAREVVDEIDLLVRYGVREVTLLGQTVNSYADPEGAVAPESGFAELLGLIAERVPALRRLRYTSPHPRHLTRALIRAHAELPVLCRHVHLPVQSGSDRVLKRMIRRYTVAEYSERVAALRSAVPGVTLSTDVIVGFPGETCADFEATLQLVDAIGYTGVFGFKYSPRPYTPALRLNDDVAEAEKSARLAELFRLSESQRRGHLASLVGGVEAVLVEGRGQNGSFTGRTERNEIVHFASAADPTGDIVDVRILRAFKNSLEGEPADASLAATGRSAAPLTRGDGRRALPLLRSP